MTVTQQDIQGTIRALGLTGRPLCLHSSLSSFEHVDGGAKTVISSFLAEGCTVLVPTFSSVFEIAPPPHLQFERNGWDYSDSSAADPGVDRIYAPEALDIDRDMGAIPAAVVAWPNRVRGNHPLNSFTAVGPRATELVAGQAPLDVYAPLTYLAQIGGYVLLIGVGLEKMTLLHLAEKEAGRTLFRRWANGAEDNPIAVEVGGCSDGFPQLEPHLSPIMRTIVVGRSAWKLFPADRAVALAAAAIRANPQVTHCDVSTCIRCNDAVVGGPMLNTDDADL